MSADSLVKATWILLVIGAFLFFWFQYWRDDAD